MMRWIVGSSMKLRLLVVAFAAAMMFFGIRQLRHMPVDVLPEFAPPYVEIQTEALGLSAEEVAQLITIPFEQDLLNGVAWLETIHSKSVSGMSSIVLTFEPGTDLFRARQMVAERVAQAYAMPHVSKPPAMLQPVSSINRVMMIRLSSKELSLIQMSMLARWTIGPRLMGVPGVANVATWGQRERQLQVQVDPDRLAASGVSLDQVLETTGNALWVSSLSFVEASTPGTGGFIDTANQRLGIRHISPIVTAQALAEVPIADQAKSDRPALRLSDVANVVEDHQPLIGDAIDDEVPSLLLVVEKFPGSNTLEVTRGLEASLAELRPGLSGVEIDSSIYRPADSIQMALVNLSTTLIISGVLVVLVLFALLSDWRSGLVSLVAVVTSLLSAALVLYVSGATFNAIMLAGLVIAVGIVIDDAIIDVDNVARRLRQHRLEKSGKSTASVMLEALLEMRSAMVFGTLIIALTILPILFIQGESGDFFRPLAVSYGLALLASMLVAVIVTPALCVLLLAKTPTSRREAPLVQWLRTGFDGVLVRSLLRPRVALAAFAGVVAAGIAVTPFFSPSLLPNFKERNVLIRLNALPGTSQPEMSRIMALINRELRSIPGVHDVGALTGRAVRGDQVVGVNSAELWVSFDPTANYDSASVAIREVVDGYPGLRGEVLTYLNERSRQAMKAPGDPIVVRIFGEDPAVLRTEAEKVRKTLSDVDGVADLHVTLTVEEPTLEIQPDLAKAQRYGIKPGDVRRAAATLLSGISVGSLFEEQKVFDVVVWSTPETRHSLDDVRGMLIDTPSGGHVRLGDVAEVRFVSTPNVIEREAVSRYLDVGANVRGRDLASVRGDVEQRLKQVQFPLEYHAELRGEFANRQAAESRLLGLAVAAAIGIFFLLQAAFKSWRLAAGVFVALPAALMGGVLAAFANGAIASLGAIIGLLTVLGIAVRNGVALITRYRDLELRDGDAFGTGLVLRGTRERFRPIVTTALTMVLAFLPFALRGPIAGLEIVHPMAVVILGGLIISTAFSLFGVPSLYVLLGAERESDLELEATTLTEGDTREAVSSRVPDLELA